MEILQQFGFRWELFAAQVINFLILAFIFQRFLYKPLLKVMRTREEKIRQGLDDAEKARLEKEETQKARTEILKKTRTEAEAILSETKKVADAIRVKTREDAKADAQNIMKEAKEQAALEMQKMEKKMHTMSLELSESLLDRVMKGIFTPEERQKIVKRTVEKLD